MARAQSWEGAAIKPQFPTVPNDIDIDELAAQQGVDVVRDARKLKPEVWPEDEPIDDFVSDIRRLRSEHPLHVR